MALDSTQLRDEAVRDRIRLATEFLDPTDPAARSYRGDIVTMLNRSQRRLPVSLDDIRAHNRELADGILMHPFDYSLCFDQALKNIVDTLPNRASFETDEETMYYVAYVGSFGENACNPRTLNSGLLNRMVCLEGIVTRCSLVRPKVVKSVHWNENKQTFHFREYRDQTMSVGKPGSMSVYPQKDDEDNPVCYSSERLLWARTDSGIACDRVWLLHVPRSSDDFDSGDAGEGACGSATQRCRCNHGR